jgi:hypothetical protein
VVGTTVTETVVFNSGDHTSAGQTVSDCDAKGGDCEDAITVTYDSDDDETGGGHGDGDGHGDGGDGDNGDGGDSGDGGDGDGDGSGDDGHGDPGSDHGGYVNPDHVSDTVVMVPTLAGVTRILGGNVTPVRGWTPPYVDGTLPENKLTGIMYVDDTAGVYGTTFDEPRITTAQPEFAGGMPDPTRGAPPPNPGGCDGLC